MLIVAPGAAKTGYSGADRAQRADLRFRRVYGGKRWGLPLPRIGGYLREFEPDIVHVVNPMMMGIAAVVAARLARLPLVASYHTNVARYASYYRLGFLRRSSGGCCAGCTARPSQPGHLRRHLRELRAHGITGSRCGLGASTSTCSHLGRCRCRASR